MRASLKELQVIKTRDTTIYDYHRPVKSGKANAQILTAFEFCVDGVHIEHAPR